MMRLKKKFMQIQHSTLDLKQKAKKQYKYSILIFEKLVLGPSSGLWNGEERGRAAAFFNIIILVSIHKCKCRCITNPA